MNAIRNLGENAKLRKVCLLSDHHLSMNPRLWKEAFFYENQGFEVVILTMWQSKDLLRRDLAILAGHDITYKAYLNLIHNEINSFFRFFYRARKKVASEIQRLCKMGSGWAISYAPELMLEKALREDADLYAAHLECAFFTGRNLIKAGKKVSFDFEDWYSRDYLVPERPIKLLESLEKYALQKGLFCTAASESMARALKEKYNINKEITVIYNGFSQNESFENNFTKIAETTIESINHCIKLLWFSRTIGPERGIEFLFKGLTICNIPVELHLLGDMTPGYGEFLKKEFPYLGKHHLVIHPFMPHDQLLGFIAQFQIGLAIEENINDNKSLTISNKMLQYIQAGLPVIASDTIGQNEVAKFFPSAVTIVDINDPVQLSDAIQSLDKKKNSKEDDQKGKFEKIFSWEAQEKKLVSLLDRKL